MTRTSRAAALAALDALYAQLPALECKGLCHDSCTVTEASELERQRIRDRGVDLGPSVSRRRLLAQIAEDNTPRCPALGPLNTCTVYEIRPFLCRVFGLTPGLRCEHGCIPAELIDDTEALRVLYDIERLSIKATGVRRKPPPL